MRPLRPRLIPPFLALALVFGSWPAAAQTQYAFTSIDYPGIPFTEVFGVNNSGHVVGVSIVSFVYDSRTGAFTTVPPPDDPSFVGGAVFGITEAGVMAGVVIRASDFGESGFVRSKKGDFTVFSKPGWENIEVRGINNRGLITGYAFDFAFTATVGFIYDPAQNTFIDILPGPFTVPQGSTPYQSFAIPDAQLLEFPGAPDTTPEGITNAGDIVGIWLDDAGTFHGFIATPLSKAKQASAARSPIKIETTSASRRRSPTPCGSALPPAPPRTSCPGRGRPA
jgi:hypothetical protein